MRHNQSAYLSSISFTIKPCILKALEIEPLLSVDCVKKLMLRKVVTELYWVFARLIKQILS